MIVLLLALVAASVSAPKFWSRIVPVGAEDEFRAQAISRTGAENDWPFASESGYLMCTLDGEKKVVFFFEDFPTNPVLDPDAPGQHGALISLDPRTIDLGKMGTLSVFARTPSLKDLLRRLQPYADIGRALCDQPPGTVIGPSET
jgi:hypothetical protein